MLVKTITSTYESTSKLNMPLANGLDLDVKAIIDLHRNTCKEKLPELTKHEVISHTLKIHDDRLYIELKYLLTFEKKVTISDADIFRDVFGLQI